MFPRIADFLSRIGCLAVLWLAAGAVHADTLLGVYAGAGTWQQRYSGEIASAGTEVDVARDLDMRKQNGNVLYAALEHGVPVLPDLRMSYADLSTRGRHTLTRTVVFNGQNFDLSDEVTADIDVRQADAVIYYQLLDGVVSVDLGVAARWIEGHVEVVSSTAVGRAEFEEMLPLLYARSRLDLPFSGFWLGAEVMGVSYQGDRLLDATAQAGWESPVGIGAELGWRSFSLKMKGFEDIDAARLNVRGPYAALNFHF